MTSSAQIGAQSIGRAVGLLEALVESKAEASLAHLARLLNIPLSTAHRMAAELTRSGLLVRVARGRYMAGFGLLALAGNTKPNSVLIALARPILRKLALRTCRTAHMAQLDDDMVTYLVRESPGRSGLFTRESMQLEAYCSAIGKVLLTMAEPGVREAYLADGSFVSLTNRTIVQPSRLRAHLDAVDRAGYATDDEEVEIGLFCIAVPLDTPRGVAPTALSLAGPVLSRDEHEAILAELTETRAALSAVFGMTVHGRPKPSSRGRSCLATNRP